MRRVELRVTRFVDDRVVRTEPIDSSCVAASSWSTGFFAREEALGGRGGFLDALAVLRDGFVAAMPSLDTVEARFDTFLGAGGGLDESSSFFCFEALRFEADLVRRGFGGSSSASESDAPRFEAARVRGFVATSSSSDAAALRFDLDLVETAFDCSAFSGVW